MPELPKDDQTFASDTSNMELAVLFIKRAFASSVGEQTMPENAIKACFTNLYIALEAQIRINQMQAHRISELEKRLGIK